MGSFRMFLVHGFLLLACATCNPPSGSGGGFSGDPGGGGGGGGGGSASPGPTAILFSPTTTASNRLVTKEDGTAAVASVVLAGRPTSTVAFDLVSSAPSEGTVAPVTVTFTPSDWSVPQRLTITGVADTVADGDQPYEVRVANVVSTDARYNGLSASPIFLTNVDMTPDAGGGACATLLGAPSTPITLRTDNTGLVLADLDKDNILDAVIAARQSHVVSVLLGNGNGTFKARADYNAAVNSADVAVGDLDGDTNVDVVATSAPTGSAGAVSVLLGSANGTLQTKVDYPTGQGTLNVAMADLNGDTKLDVIAVNATDNTVSVLLGNGNGTLQAKADYATGNTPGGIVVADVDGDTKKDVVVINVTDNTVSVLLGNGDGTLQTKVDYPTDTTPTGLAIADVNGDGKLDLVTSNSSGAVNPSVVSVLLGVGNGTFQAKSSVVTGLFPGAVRLVDLDGDSKLDIVCPAAGADRIAVNRGNGDGTFRAVETYTTGAGTGPSQIAVGKLRSMGRPDVFAILSSTDQATVLLNPCP